MIPRLSQAVSGLDSNKYFIAIASLSFEFIAFYFNAVSAYMEERTFEFKMVLTQKPQKERKCLARLTHGYMDGGAGICAEQYQNTISKNLVFC
jgi:hypothetical protein